MNYLKIQWSNSCNLDSIYYVGGFSNLIYLDTELCAPDYEEDLEEKEDYNGNVYPVYQKTTKIYKFELMAPEYLVDALKLLPFHDSVTVSYTDGTFNGSAKNIKVDVEWDSDTNNCLAKVTVSFTGSVVKKGTCC